MWVHPFRWKELEDEEREKTMNEFEKSDKPVCVSVCEYACQLNECCAKKNNTASEKSQRNKEQHVCLEIVQATDRVHVQANI